MCGISACGHLPGWRSGLVASRGFASHGSPHKLTMFSLERTGSNDGANANRFMGHARRSHFRGASQQASQGQRHRSNHKQTRSSRTLLGALALGIVTKDRPDIDTRMAVSLGLEDALLSVERVLCLAAAVLKVALLVHSPELPHHPARHLRPRWHSVQVAALRALHESPCDAHPGASHEHQQPRKLQPTPPKHLQQGAATPANWPVSHGQKNRNALLQVMPQRKAEWSFDGEAPLALQTAARSSGRAPRGTCPSRDSHTRCPSMPRAISGWTFLCCGWLPGLLIKVVPPSLAVSSLSAPCCGRLGAQCEMAAT